MWVKWQYWCVCKESKYPSCTCPYLVVSTRHYMTINTNNVGSTSLHCLSWLLCCVYFVLLSTWLCITDMSYKVWRGRTERQIGKVIVKFWKYCLHWQIEILTEINCCHSWGIASYCAANIWPEIFAWLPFLPPSYFHFMDESLISWIFC